MSRRPLANKKHVHRPQPVQPRQPKLVRPPKRKLPAQYRRS
jgi:hypothetical protein